MKRNLRHSDPDRKHLPRPNLFQKSADRMRERAARRSLFRPWHSVFIFMGLAIFVVRYAVEIGPHKIEYGYARGIYPWIIFLLSLPARVIPRPYSASELFFSLSALVIILWFGFNLYGLIRNQMSVLTFLFKIVAHTAAGVAFLFFIYMSAWGFNYLREPFFLSLNPAAGAESLQPADYEELAYDMLSLVNSLRRTVNLSADTQDFQESDHQVDIAVEEVMNTTLSLDIQHPPGTKTLLFNECLNALGISGFFSPFFAEPHINSDLLPWEDPMIMAHEKAHFIGFASETDANLIAYIACLSDESERLRYSGALHILLSLRHYIPRDKWQELMKENLSTEVRKDIKARNERIRNNYKKYPGLLRAGRKVNDTYLRLNSQNLGIGSYQAALPHVVIWWKTRKIDFQ